MNSKTDQEQGVVHIPVAPGELIDKLTILEIKLEEIKDEKKLENIRVEYELLARVLNDHVEDTSELETLHHKLRKVNKIIWDCEDALRVCWQSDDFGDEYVKQTTTSHKHNDERMKLKREINLLLGSKIVEEKSHIKN